MVAAAILLVGVADADVIGDRAYDAGSLRDQLRRQRCRVVIPSNPTRRIQRRYDREAYKRRHHVENFFQRLKRFRRIATRYEALTGTFLGMLSLASALLWVL
jgi:putative transposase